MVGIMRGAVPAGKYQVGITTFGLDRWERTAIRYCMRFARPRVCPEKRRKTPLIQRLQGRCAVLSCCLSRTGRSAPSRNRGTLGDGSSRGCRLAKCVGLRLIHLPRKANLETRRSPACELILPS